MQTRRSQVEWVELWIFCLFICRSCVIVLCQFSKAWVVRCVSRRPVSGTDRRWRTTWWRRCCPGSWSFDTLPLSKRRRTGSSLKTDEYRHRWSWCFYTSVGLVCRILAGGYSSFITILRVGPVEGLCPAFPLRKYFKESLTPGVYD